MFAKERQDHIREEIQVKGSILVKELAVHYGVTEDCIRKDLAFLEKKGVLERTYGGAVLKRVNVHKEYVRERKIDADVPKKREMAKTALSLIHDDDMIFLDISTTNIELAREIHKANKRITVVSNMVEIMDIFREPCDSTFHFIGGTFNRGRDAFLGALTIAFLKHYHFDIAFMGAVGIDVQSNSVNTYVADDGLTKQTIMQKARKTYVLCEHKKFQHEGNFTYAKLQDFSGVILESNPSKELLKALKQFHLEIYSAKE